MSAPRATYRLQFRNGFDFAAAAGIAGYLARLGVSHLYASPIFTAAPGSTHGYDVTDFNEIEPDLGGLPGLRDLVAALRRHDLGLVVDFVPNHMAATWENHWWREALAKGPDGPHGESFDIDWGRRDGRVILPVLGAGLDEVIASGELSVGHGPEGFFLRYYDRRFPLRDHENMLPAGAKAAAVTDTINRDRRRLKDLVDAQFYRLVLWRDGPELINYRRFFEIDDLVSLRMDRRAVFDAAHRLLLSLVAEGLLHGIRLDHIDGLADPEEYLRRLRGEIDRAAGHTRTPIWVEKILSGDERLKESWPIAGTTGYEFAAALTRLQTKPAGLDSLTAAYQRFVDDDAPFGATARQAKQETLRVSFPAEFAALVTLACELLDDDVADNGISEPDVAEALREVLAAMPVYRSYLAGSRPDESDFARFAAAAAHARAGTDAGGTRALDALTSLAHSVNRRRFFTRFEHLSSALAAKAVEDTAFYRYLPLASLNEVGGGPEAGTLSLDEFHAANEARRRASPNNLLATTSHDTKRGEDVRARLSVLSEIPSRFIDVVERCRRGRPASRVHPKDAWLLCQTLVGMWPPVVNAEDASALASLGDRLQAYAVKAAREAKERSSWVDSDAGYEAELTRFAGMLTGDSAEAECRAAIRDLSERIAAAGAANGLVQALVKLTAPGVPDIYQGSECWELSLVDPDNRRPVDFPALEAGLRRDADVPLAELLSRWRDGSIKQALIARVLELRAASPELFSRGAYVPLSVDGPDAQHVIAFARSRRHRFAVVAALRHAFDHLRSDAPCILPGRLAGTALALPVFAVRHDMRNLLTGDLFPPTSSIPCSDLFMHLPIALLAPLEPNIGT